MPEAIRVMAVYDEPIIIEGLRSIIGRTESMIFVGAVTSPDELFAALGATHCDVIIMDYLISDDDCGNPDGLYLLRQIRVSHPAVRSILYTSVNRDGLRESAIAMGADAVLCKRDPLDVLTKTIQVLASGSMRIAPASRVCADTTALAAGLSNASNRGEGRRAFPSSPTHAKTVRAQAHVSDGPQSTMLAREPFNRWPQGTPVDGPLSNRVTGGALPAPLSLSQRQWERSGEANAATSRWSSPSRPAKEAADRGGDEEGAPQPRRSAESTPAPAPAYYGGASAGVTAAPESFSASPARLPYDALIRCPDVLANSASNGTRGVWLENRLSLTRLSPRETEIVRLLSNGRSLKEVAAYLGRSAKTISNQKRSAMLKLGLHSDIDLLRFAIEAGLT